MSAVETPAVSVVVPTRDRPAELARAVAAILGQRYAGPVECIVVFDQCEPADIPVETGPDRTIRTLSNTRTPGLAGGRNSGILAATGEFIGFCDDDDEWLPDKVATQVELFRAHPDARVVGCDVVLQDGDRTISRPVPVNPVTLDHLVRSRVWELHPGTVLARRSAVVDEIGLVDEELPGSYCEDYDWLLRAARFGPIPIASTAGLQVNWHGGSFFGKRWQTIIDALTYLLAKHKEFADAPDGRARLEGQIAFAHSALGNRKEARRWARLTLRDNWREKRAYLALAISARVLSAERVLQVAQARGRGV